ncbi:unnamed protein product [Lymnaea stagnalis]|uniref:Wiskott-Aldrich syndrome protein family member n=1 Tax=Lymnaea stagnalis TaxID=6523 RepID=A0AAV2I651_LYMST
MPHIKRIIEPVLVSRRPVNQGVRDDLECITNNTLANIIRELSSLSRHAEDLFRELSMETGAVFRRGTTLQRRIEDVRDKVTQLNPNVDVLNLQDIHLQKPFKSSNKKEQQVLSKSTVPRAILEVYDRCDAPPALDKLDKFREDGKNSMKFYTDPSYFAELWAIEMGKQIQENKKLHDQKRKRGERTQNQRSRPVKPAKPNLRDKYKHLGQGVDLADVKVQISSNHSFDTINMLTSRSFLVIFSTYTLNTKVMISLRQLHLQEQQQQLEEARRQSQQRKQQEHYPPPPDHYKTPVNHHKVDPPANIHDSYVGHEYNHYPAQPNPDPSVGNCAIRTSPDKMANGSTGKKTAPQGHRPNAPPPAPPPQTNRDSLPPPPPSPPPSNYPGFAHNLPNPVPGYQTPRMTKGDSLRDSPKRHHSSLNVSSHLLLFRCVDKFPVEQNRTATSPTPTYQRFLWADPAATATVTSTHRKSYSVSAASTATTPSPAPTNFSERSNETQSLSSGSNSTGVPAEPLRPPIGGDRSALMKEIIQVDLNKRLRKTEERGQKKQAPISAPGTLDVQAIMDKAIEMRRKVIEISDSGGEESDDSDAWGDSD